MTDLLSLIFTYTVCMAGLYLFIVEDNSAMTKSITVHAQTCSTVQTIKLSVVIVLKNKAKLTDSHAKNSKEKLPSC